MDVRKRNRANKSVVDNRVAGGNLRHVGRSEKQSDVFFIFPLLTSGLCKASEIGSVPQIRMKLLLSVDIFINLARWALIDPLG